jgi:hypothetical protein
MEDAVSEPVPVGDVVRELVDQMFPEGFMPERFMPLEPDHE